MSQVQKNKSVLKLLKKHGDDLTNVREVSHWIYFKTFDDLADYKSIVAKKGFKIGDIHHDDNHTDVYPFSLIIYKDDNVELDNINEVTIELSRLAEEFNGFYDGWETPIVK